MGWEPVVICVDEKYVEASSDPVLNHTIPPEIEVHKIKAWPVKITRKFGLGSLSLRSLVYFRKKGNELLRKGKFDLVYFSTTAFHVCWLGPYWKKKFKIPFIIDVQDPWRNDFYLDKPRSERPPKFYLAYKIDKFLEARTIPKVDGIISVSKGYCDTFLSRYPVLKEKQFKVITFGAMPYDFEIMNKYVHGSSKVKLPEGKYNIVYIGRGGHDMRYALEIIFHAFKKGLERGDEKFLQSHLSFIGTSYAAAGDGNKTIEPVAKQVGVEKYVTEITDRIPYFETLFLLKQADMLIVPGSTDTSYTASKIFPYLMVQKPLLAVFYKDSSVVNVLEDLNIGQVVKFDHTLAYDKYVDECYNYLESLMSENKKEEEIDMSIFEKYTARAKTLEQVDFFNMILGY